MDGKRKHHNLRHLLTPQQQAAALCTIAGPDATAAAAGELILAARQRDLQQMFAAVYNVATNSCERLGSLGVQLGHVPPGLRRRRRRRLPPLAVR